MNKKRLIKIKRRKIGEGHPCFIIAEAGLAHAGSFKSAKQYIDAIARTGADAVKFQTHIAEAESTLAEPWRVRFNRKDKTRYNYWERTAFTKKQWKQLAQYARRKKLIFLSSPFSEEAVTLLGEVGMPAWKIPSGEVNNLPLIEVIAKKKKPVLVSSGMSSWAELDQTVKVLRRHHAPFAVFQCSSFYPCPAGKIGLNIFEKIQKRYGCLTGLSDHSGHSETALAAVALGVSFLEVHVILKSKTKGPDASSSLTMDALKTLVSQIRFVERVVQNPVDKNAISRELAGLRRIFNKSIVARKNLKKGTILKKSHLAFKKPGIGISTVHINQLVGKILKRDLCKNDFLRFNDLRSCL